MYTCVFKQQYYIIYWFRRTNPFLGTIKNRLELISMVKYGVDIPYIVNLRNRLVKILDKLVIIFIFHPLTCSKGRCSINMHAV